MTRLGFHILSLGGGGRHNLTHKRYCYGLFLDQRFLNVGGSLDLSHRGPKRKVANSHLFQVCMASGGRKRMRGFLWLCMKEHVVSTGTGTSGSGEATELDDRTSKTEVGCAPPMSPKGDSATPLRNVPHLKGGQGEA